MKPYELKELLEEEVRYIARKISEKIKRSIKT